MTRVIDQARTLADVASRQAAALLPAALPPEPPPIPANPATLLRDAMEYTVDAGQRGILYLDAMRQAGNIFVEHEAAGCPPVLFFEWDMVVRRPHTWRGPATTPWCASAAGRRRAARPEARPFVIIDPRAGHGAGIGGFKADSQVGVALQRGHPGLFRDLLPRPEPGQTIADIIAAEGASSRKVDGRIPMRRSPS